MNDRELLELAAKAINLNNMQFIEKCMEFGYSCGLGYEDKIYWNPLTDDGDALRLAVKLGLTITPNYHVENSSLNILEFTELYDSNDYCYPTRQAIVRAAAEVAKSSISHDEFIFMFNGRFDDETVEHSKVEIGETK